MPGDWRMALDDPLNPLENFVNVDGDLVKTVVLITSNFSVVSTTANRVR